MENRKAHLKQAQQRHLASLFGSDDAKRPAAQQADDHAAARARRLAKAAEAKQASLSDDELRQLDQLKQRSTGAPQNRPSTGSPNVQPVSAQSTPKETKSVPSKQDTLAELSALSDRNDLASAALRNMRDHARRTKQTPAQSQPIGSTAKETPPPNAARSDSVRKTDAPATSQGSRPAAASAPRRPAPSPEELDALLKRMASRAQRGGERAGGPEAVEAAPQAAEAPPPPPEVDIEKDREKQAELVEKLRAKESRLRETIKPIEQVADTQVLAEEKPVEATVPIRVDSNAVSSGPLHDAIVKLQAAQRAHDARGQVDGANDVQRNIPGHPLYQEPS